jgi:hypothetical protein
MRGTMTEIEKAKRVAELLKQVKEENPDLSAQELSVQEEMTYLAVEHPNASKAKIRRLFRRLRSDEGLSEAAITAAAKRLYRENSRRSEDER